MPHYLSVVAGRNWKPKQCGPAIENASSFEQIRSDMAILVVGRVSMRPLQVINLLEEQFHLLEEISSL